LIVGLGIFVAILGYLVVTSLTRRNTPTFVPRPPQAGGLAGGITTDTVTIDASNSESWSYLDLDHGLSLDAPDTAGWDLALQRFRMRAAGMIHDIGPADFEAPLAQDTLLEGPARNDERGDIGHWYRYSMLSHLLEPKGHVYVLRTTENRIAKIEILSYYCPNLEAGCMTFRMRSVHSP